MRKTESKESEESFYACSAQECTGLIPALPRDREEQEAYEELYPFARNPADTRHRYKKRSLRKTPGGPAVISGRPQGIFL